MQKIKDFSLTQMLGLERDRLILNSILKQGRRQGRPTDMEMTLWDT